MRTAKLVAASTLVAAALYGCSPRSEAQAPPAPAVTVATPLVQAVQDWDEFTGRFEATQEVEVRARVGGYISGVHFRDGDYVRRGQLLFTLDPRPAQAALAAARAQLAQAQAQLALARSELARSESLLESQAVSQAEVDTRRGALQTAQAAIAAANANVRARRLDLEFTRVTAPISGRASDRRVDPGNLVAGGSSAADVLTSIVSSAPIHFVFDGSEAVLLKYQRQARNGAAPIQVRLQDEATFTRSGTLDFTDNAIDGSSGTVRLRAVVANADGFLKPGMFGRGRLAGTTTYTGMLVPDAAIVTDGARKVVYVVAADGTVAAKAVELGPLAGDLRVVRSGLTPTDRVIVTGVQRARPGQKVTPRATRITARATTTEVPTTTAPPASAATLTGSLPAASVSGD
jgi:RND family efflux transporter MFP subunit